MEINAFYVTKTLILDKSFSEIDFVLHDEMGYRYDDDENSDFVIIEKGGHCDTSEATPISIDTVLKLLNDMKAKGASHVEIEHNIDSIGYAFSGFCIDKSTNEEIQEYENKFKKKKSKDDKINELLNEINKLKLEKD